MSSANKSKFLESAQKQISKGNLDKALKEYQKILKSDPSDTSVRLKAGDLCERMGDRAQALAEYRRVASTFTSQGFYSKAVAVLKRIQKADPDQIEIHLELAELNEKLGLLSEVVHHYQLAANVHDRKGEKRAAIDILKKVSEVGQSNLERKLKVAELYFKEGFPEAGYEQFIHATSELDEQSPDLVEIAIRMCKASPEDTQLIQRLGEIHLTQGDPKRAIELFQQAREIAVEPRTLELMAKAKLQIELPGEAKTLFEKAAALYESSGDKRLARDASARATELAEQALDAPAPFGEKSVGQEAPADEPVQAGETAGDAIPEIDAALDELPPTDEEGSVGASQEES
ncbi:MAG: tetratricopeptide repeat protein, partial [Deltaproteobacteria bacterium]|nr:tetratricopeptide repeat protein [Deltaproteobacteria bacterium]